MGKNIKKEVDTLCKALRKDKELYYAYQSNIAMAFVDEFARYAKIRDYVDNNAVHLIANEAAKNFLNLFIEVKP